MSLVSDPPLISVIVRTQNRPHLLHNALSSLAAQTWPALEAVVVNDGGQDVEAVTAPFAEKISGGLRVIRHEQAQGRSAAANGGLQAARGEWIAFLDDDDTLENDGLEKLARYIPWDKNMIYGRVKVLQMDPDPGKIQQSGMFGEPFSAERLLLENYIPICGYICRKELALACGGFDPAFEYLEDWDFLFRLSRLSAFHYVPEIVAHYRVWGEAFVTRRKTDKENRFRTLFFDKHRAQCTPEALQQAALALVDASDRRFGEIHKLWDQAPEQCRREIANYQKIIDHQNQDIARQQEELAAQEDRLRQAQYQVLRDQAWWRGQVNALVNKITSALPFDIAEIDLDRYGLSPLMRLFSGEEQNAHEVGASLPQIEQPLVMFKQRARWKLVWGGRSPGQVLSFKMAAYSRINRCHLDLQVYRLSETGEIGELQAQARLEGPAVKDNRYAGFSLDRSLPPGEYVCVLASPDADTQNALGIYLAPRQVAVDLPGPENAHGIPRLSLPDADTYKRWYQFNYCRPGQLEAQRREVLEWDQPPLISLIVPCYNSRPEWLRELLESLLGQTYPRWECLLVDDASPQTEHLSVIREHCAQDPRFRLQALETNQGVGAACRAGVEAAQGAYVAILDHDDLLEPQALYEMVKAIRQHQPDVLYSDEMLVDEKGGMLRCEFRPDFNYYFLLSHPYIIHLTLLRREIVLQAGNFDSSLTVSQDYDLLLRIAALTRAFLHLPKVLYRWRTYEKSTGHQQREKVTENSLAALNRHLRQVNAATSAWAEEGLAFNFFRVRYPLAPCTVSVIIPTRDRVDLLEVCIGSLTEKTRLPAGVKLEIIVVDNGSEKPESLEYFETLRRAGHSVLPEPGPFNFSQLNNRAAEKAGGEFLLFLNNDIEVVEPGWLEAMLELMGDPKVGVVGAKLIYPNIGLIQHAGVIMGFNGIAGHDHQFYPEYDEEKQLLPGHNHSLLVIRECLAVTAACMLVRRGAFEQAGGYDENLHVGFGDTDLCLKIHQQGFLCLYTPYARLIHHESASRGKQADDPHPIDSALFLQRWEKRLEAGDPWYNPNLAKHGMMFQPRLPG